MLETELRQLREKLAPTESAVQEANNKLKKLQVVWKNPLIIIGDCDLKIWQQENMKLEIDILTIF